MTSEQAQAENAREVIEPMLESHERLLWTGKPQQGVRFGLVDIPLSLFGLFFMIPPLGILLAPDSENSNPNAPNAPSDDGFDAFGMLFFIPFFLVGIYFVVARFFVDAKGRKRTYYAVTNRRAIIVSGLFSQNIQSLNLRGLADITLAVKKDGRGSIQFGSPQWSNTSSGFRWPGMPQTPAFDSIKNAKEVHDLIRRTQQEA